MSTRLDAVALVTAVSANDSEGIELVLDGSDLRDVAVVLAQIVCAAVEHAHGAHGCPLDLEARIKRVGRVWTLKEASTDAS
jgi:hypothetical protein